MFSSDIMKYGIDSRPILENKVHDRIDGISPRLFAASASVLPVKAQRVGLESDEQDLSADRQPDTDSASRLMVSDRGGDLLPHLRIREARAACNRRRTAASMHRDRWLRRIRYMSAVIFNPRGARPSCDHAIHFRQFDWPPFQVVDFAGIPLRGRCE
jgi:hypothetical protein